MSLTQLIESHWSACYRLALALVGEANAAEDVTQEALLAAFESQASFDASRELKPWLFGIVHKRALMHHRGRTRRAAREERVARPERAEDAPGVEAAEQAALIREHLQRIKAEYRHAVALRYLEGMSLAQVAEALGIPQGTVSSRIRRGLKALEGSLQPVLGIAGAALLAAVKVALREAEVPPAPAADALARRGRPRQGGPLAAPGGSPPRRIAQAAALTAAVAAALAAALLLGGGDPEPEPDVAGGAGPSTPVTAPSADAVPGAATPDATPGAAEADAAPAGPASSPTPLASPLRGRVSGVEGLRDGWVRRVDPQRLQLLLGSPLVGGSAETARRELGRARFGWNVPAESTPLDAAGGFALELPPGEHLLAVGAYGCRTRLLTVQAPLAEPLDVSLTWLFPASVALRVVDEDGLPYSGHLAYVRSDVAEQAPWVDGLEAWVEQREGGARLLRWFRAGGLDLLPLDDRGAAELALPAGDYTLQLEVRANVRERGSIAPFHGSSLPAAKRALTLAAGESATWEIEIGWRQSMNQGHGARVDIEVVDPSGGPVPGAFVQVDAPPDSLGGLRRQDSGYATWVTGADGRARLVGLREGEQLAVRARAGDRWTGLGESLATGGPHEPGQPVPLLRLVLDEAFVTGALRLRLADAETGEAPRSTGLATVTPSTISFADAWRVSLRALSGQLAVWGSRFDTLPDGTLQIDELPPGRWQVEVEQPQAPREASYLPGAVEVEVRAGATTAATVELPRGQTLQGRVRVDGEPVMATVSLVHGPDLRSAGHTRLDGEGRFALSALRGDLTYSLIVEPDGTSSNVFPFLFSDVKPSDGVLEFDLPGDLAIAVRVTDELGRPLEGAFVHCSLPEGRDHRTLETDALGEVRWRGRFRGERVIRVGRQGYLSLERTVTQGGARIDAALEPDPDSALISGRVVDGHGQPLAGVTVSASNPTTTTDAQGEFSLRVDTGTAYLYAKRDGYVRERRDLEVGPDGVHDLTLTLQRGSRIVGRLVAPPERRERLRVGIQLIRDDGKRGDKDGIDHDADGWFRTRDVYPPLRLKVFVIDRDRREVVLEHELQLERGVDTDLELVVPE